MKLYHYTCGHGAEGIIASGVIRPYDILWMSTATPPVVWLTDMREVDAAESLGLTSTYLDCDRLEHRFIVRVAAQRWDDFALLHGVDGTMRATVEAYATPDRWFLATEPVTSWRYDDAYRKVAS